MIPILRDDRRSFFAFFCDFGSGCTKVTLARFQDAKYTYEYDNRQD